MVLSVCLFYSLLSHFKIWIEIVVSTSRFILQFSIRKVLNIFKPYFGHWYLVSVFQSCVHCIITFLRKFYWITETKQLDLFIWSINFFIRKFIHSFNEIQYFSFLRSSLSNTDSGDQGKMLFLRPTTRWKECPSPCCFIPTWQPRQKMC